MYQHQQAAAGAQQQQGEREVRALEEQHGNARTQLSLAMDLTADLAPLLLLPPSSSSSPQLHTLSQLLHSYAALETQLSVHQTALQAVLTAMRHQATHPPTFHSVPLPLPAAPPSSSAAASRPNKRRKTNNDNDEEEEEVEDGDGSASVTQTEQQHLQIPVDPQWGDTFSKALEQAQQAAPPTEQHPLLKEYRRKMRDSVQGAGGGADEILESGEEPDEEGEGEERSSEEVRVAGGTQQDMMCPLSKQVMIQPLKNASCAHSYSREAILHYLGVSPLRPCPVAGCVAQVTKAALSPNLLLQRAIEKHHKEQARLKQKRLAQVEHL